MINMTWKDIIKNLEFDPTETCCATLKTDYIQFVHKLADHFESIGKHGKGIRNHDRLADESCEVVLDSLNQMLSKIGNSPPTRTHPSWVKDELEKIIDDFEKCKEEPHEEPVKDTNKPEWFEQTGAEQTSWMNDFIR
tara:strand:- start:2615 stop:3025 length:411 start_codon:yes stop_codon:yes gene_type:complete